jgi:hypothetical protein
MLPTICVFLLLPHWLILARPALRALSAILLVPLSIDAGQEE